MRARLYVVPTSLRNGYVTVMAIYHFSAKVISRANGSSAVASAAYRSACELNDERLGRSQNFTNKTGVVHSEIMAPEGSPERWQDRETLWNEVEAGEKRKDAQLAREIEFAIPREMSQAQGVELAQVPRLVFRSGLALAEQPAEQPRRSLQGAADQGERDVVHIEASRRQLALPGGV